MFQQHFLLAGIRKYVITGLSNLSHKPLLRFLSMALDAAVPSGSEKSDHQAVPIADSRVELIQERSYIETLLYGHAGKIGTLHGFLNGALDHSEEIRHQTVVIERYYGSRWMRDEVVVRSWRAGRTKESVYVSALQAFFLMANASLSA